MITDNDDDNNEPDKIPTHNFLSVGYLSVGIYSAHHHDDHDLDHHCVWRTNCSAIQLGDTLSATNSLKSNKTF